MNSTSLILIGLEVSCLIAVLPCLRLTIPPFVPELDDIDLQKVKRGECMIGNFIGRMNQFALGRLIIAKRNRVVTEEEDREWKMIFKARNWNKLRSSTDELS